MKNGVQLFTSTYLIY